MKITQNNYSNSYIEYSQSEKKLLMFLELQALLGSAISIVLLILILILDSNPSLYLFTRIISFAICIVFLIISISYVLYLISKHSSIRIQIANEAKLENMKKKRPHSHIKLKQRTQICQYPNGHLSAQEYKLLNKNLNILDVSYQILGQTNSKLKVTNIDHPIIFFEFICKGHLKSGLKLKINRHQIILNLPIAARIIEKKNINAYKLRKSILLFKNNSKFSTGDEGISVFRAYISAFNRLFLEKQSIIHKSNFIRVSRYPHSIEISFNFDNIDFLPNFISFMYLFHKEINHWPLPNISKKHTSNSQNVGRKKNLINVIARNERNKICVICLKVIGNTSKLIKFHCCNTVVHSLEGQKWIRMKRYCLNCLKINPLTTRV